MITQISQRRAIPEVVAVLEAGQRADTLLYLPPEEQRVQLERRLRLAREREQKRDFFNSFNRV
jgi:hypothetical protein